MKLQIITDKKGVILATGPMIDTSSPVNVVGDAPQGISIEGPGKSRTYEVEVPDNLRNLDADELHNKYRLSIKGKKKLIKISRKQGSKKSKQK